MHTALAFETPVPSARRHARGKGEGSRQAQVPTLRSKAIRVSQRLATLLQPWVDRSKGTVCPGKLLRCTYHCALNAITVRMRSAFAGQSCELRASKVPLDSPNITVRHSHLFARQSAEEMKSLLWQTFQYSNSPGFRLRSPRGYPP
jgi:hypothetical protein